MTTKGTFKLSSGEKSITLIGEVLIDKIHDALTDSVKVLFGGSPANIAINLMNLGISDVKFYGAVGNDVFGKLILDKFKEMNISTNTINITEYPTSIVEINKTVNSPVPIFLRGADYHITLTKEMISDIKRSSIVHFSYWPLSSEPAKSTIIKVIEIAKSSEAIIGFDPNYHSKLTTEQSITLEEIKEIISKVDIIKPSIDDSQRLFGKGYSVEEYLDMYVKLGAKLVVMTLGEKGLIASYQGKTYELGTYAKNIVDATGAGDAFWSGMYAAILNNESLEDILKSGNICSAYNLSHIGGDSNLPSYTTLKQKYKIGE
jgi:fructokinase